MRAGTSCGSGARTMAMRALRIALSVEAILLGTEWLNRGAGAPLFRPAVDMAGFALDLLRWPLDNPLVWFGNYCLIAIIVLFATAVVGRLRWGTISAAAVLSMLAMASRQKIAIMGEPLFPRDLRLAGFAVEFVWSQMTLWHAAMAASVVVLLGLLVIRARRIDRACSPVRQLSLHSRIAIAAAGFLVLGSCWLMPLPGVRPLIAMHDQRPGQRHLMGPAYYAWYYHRGFALAFAQYLRTQEQAPPRGYDAQTIASIAADLANAPVAPTRTLVRPSIIVWLSESFWDPALLPGVTITPDPIRNFREICREGRRVDLVVPVFGGGSSHTELEFATGISHAYVPISFGGFLELVDLPTPSIARLFTQRGYRALAYCAGLGDLFREPQAFPLLGFEDYVYVPAADSAPGMRLPVSDAEFTGQVINAIEQSSRPVFMFAASRQGHSPYVPSLYRYYDIDVKHHITPEAASIVKVYSQSMYAADHALRALIEHFRSSAKPVVIVFYGDHLPPLESVYRETGFLDPAGESPEPVGRLRKYTTPALLWTNTQIPLPEMDTPVSPGVLMSRVLHAIGIEHPFYTTLLGRVGQLTPAISPHVTVTADGQAHLVPPEDPVLHQYNLLGYDLLFGQRYSLPSLFPECAAQ